MRPLTLALFMAAAGTALGQDAGVLPAWFPLADGRAPAPTLHLDNYSQRFNLLTWHRDGPGKPPVLAVVAWLELNGARGSMATWDGARWDLYPEVPNPAAMGRSTLFDPDGDGPEPERVCAIRMGTVPSRVVMWNGGAWQPVGALTESISSAWGALAPFDPDGPGPALPMLVHANQRVSAWSASTGWQDLGLVASLAPHRVSSLLQFDPDADGPQNPVLVLGGQFTSVGAVPATNLAVLRGIDWEPMPGLSSPSPAGQMAVHDPDGPGGPSLPELFVPTRATADGTPGELFAWNGASWRTVLPGTYDTIPNIATPQNAASIAAPGLSGLYTFGRFTSLAGTPVASIGRVAQDTLAPLSDSPGAGFSSSVDSLIAIDLDGPGPQPTSLFAMGSAQTSGGQAIPGVARWNGRRWQPLSDAFRFITDSADLPASIGSLNVVDPDGDGPAPEHTYLQGAFTAYGSVRGYGTVADFDGSTVSPLADGIREALANPGSVLRFDPDADGPAPARLYCSGVSVNAWDGQAWASTNLDTTYNATRAMCLHDFDGPGPQPPRLIAAGPNNAMGRVIQFDGAQWSPVGEGLSQGTGGSTFALLSNDPDGDGPAQPILYAGGQSPTRAWQFDGAWHPMGDFATAIEALLAFDPDGPGPMTTRIIAAGALSATDVPGGVAAWDGQAWIPLGTPPGNASALAAFDPDGDGPQRARLVASGRFFNPDSSASGWIAAWDPATLAWIPLAADATDPADTSDIHCLAIEHPFGPGGPQRLAAGLRWPDRQAGVLRFTSLGRAWLTQQPADQTVEPGATLLLSARVHHAYAGATYQWTRNGSPILTAAGTIAADDPDASLAIPAATADDAGTYQLLLTNAAGTSASREATVTLGHPCRPDFNRDGFLDFFDYDDFVACFETAACPPGATADFNGDDFSDFFDYDDFVAAFETGC